MAKKSSREFVGELAIGIVFLYKVQKPRKVIAVQLLHVCLAEALGKLPQVWTSPNLFDHLLGGCVVFFKATRIVAYEVYPRGASPPPGTNQGTVVFRGES